MFLPLQWMEVAMVAGVPNLLAHLASALGASKATCAWLHWLLTGNLSFSMIALVLPGRAIRAKDPANEHDLNGTRREWIDADPPFRELIEHGSEGTALLRPDGVFLYASPSTGNVLGSTHSTLVGRSIFEFVHPEDVRQALDNLEIVLEAPGNMRTIEMRCQRPNQSWCWVESTATNLVGNPNVNAVVANYRDIDRRKRSEEKWRSLAITDPLTGLKNYRGLVEAFEYELDMSFDFTASSTEFTDAINYASRNGVICVASAGNDGLQENVYPAALTNVMGVASVNGSGARSTFSNYGTKIVWVAAPGEDIITTYPYGTYAAGSGTSFSAPLVAGTAALILNIQQDATPLAAAADIAQAQPLAPNLGHGLLDVYLALQAAQDSH